MGNNNAPQSSNDSESQVKQEQNEIVTVPTHKETSPCKKDNGPIMKRTSFAIKIQQPSSDITNLYDDESIDKQLILDKSYLHGESTARTNEKKKILSRLSSGSKSIGDSRIINSSIMKQIFQNDQVASILVQHQEQQQTENKALREQNNGEEVDDKNINKSNILNIDCRHNGDIVGSRIRNRSSSSAIKRNNLQNQEEEEISVSAGSLDNSLQYQDKQKLNDLQIQEEQYAKRRDELKEQQCDNSNQDVSNMKETNTNEIDEDEELFNSFGIIYQNDSREEQQKTEGKEGQQKSLKTILALDQFKGQTYLVKQYSPELARQLDFDENIALALWKVQKTTDFLCKLKAISVDKSGRLNVVHSHEKGGSLGLFLDTPFSEQEAKIWITKIIYAVQILHENKIIHGNLKPNNILVGKDELKLTDVNLFRNKKCILSLYSAPELLLYEQLTEKSDIWSIGIIFVEMLCGTVPFLLKHPSLTVPELKKTIGTTKLEFSFSQETNEFIGMMCSIHPEQRKPLQEILNSKYLAADRSILSDSTELLSQSIFQKTSSLRRLLSQPKNHEMSKQSNVSSNLQQGGDKSARYGQVSILFPYVSIVNVKQNDTNQQESYIPISEANLMTTNNNASNNLSQFLPEQYQQNKYYDKEGIKWKKSSDIIDQNDTNNQNYLSEAEMKQKKKKDLEDQLMAIMNNGECSCGSCYSFYGSQQLQQQQGQSQKVSTFKPESLALTKKQSKNCLKAENNGKQDCTQNSKGNNSSNNNSSSIFRPKMSFQFQEENTYKVVDKQLDISPKTFDREVNFVKQQQVIKPIPVVFRQSSGNFIDGALKEFELQTSKNLQTDSRLETHMEKENSQGRESHDYYQKLKKKRTKSLSNDIPLLHSSSSHKTEIEKTSCNALTDNNLHKLDIPQANTWSLQYMKPNESQNWMNPRQDDHHEHHQHHHHHHHHHHNDINAPAASSSIRSSFGSSTKASHLTAKFGALGETPSNKDSLHLKLLDSPSFLKVGMQQSKIQKSLDFSSFRQQELPSPSPSCYSAAPYLHRATGDQLEPVVLMSSFPSQDSLEQDSSYQVN